MFVANVPETQGAIVPKCMYVLTTYDAVKYDQISAKSRSDTGPMSVTPMPESEDLV